MGNLAGVVTPADVCGIRFGNFKEGMVEEFTISEFGNRVHWLEFMLRIAGEQPDGSHAPPQTIRVDLSQLTMGRLSLHVHDGERMVLRPNGRTLVLIIEDGESSARGKT